jgi:hypothetical protein
MSLPTTVYLPVQSPEADHMECAIEVRLGPLSWRFWLRYDRRHRELLGLTDECEWAVDGGEFQDCDLPVPDAVWHQAQRYEAKAAEEILKTVTLPISVSIQEGIATLPNGEKIKLGPIRDYLSGCFDTTGHGPYRDMANQIAKLMGETA